MVKKGNYIEVVFYCEGGLLAFFLGVCIKCLNHRVWLVRKDGVVYSFLLNSPRILSLYIYR